MSGKISGIRIKKVAALVSGGNIDVNNMTRVINQGLIKSQRKIFFQTVIPRRTGRTGQAPDPYYLSTNANPFPSPRVNAQPARHRHGHDRRFTGTETASEKTR